MTMHWDPDAARGHTEDGYVVELVVGEASGRPLAKLITPTGEMTGWRVENAEAARAWGERVIRADRQRRNSLQPAAA
jgi:hypothetical protein